MKKYQPHRKIKYHRFCKLIPVPTPEEFNDFLEDARKHGIRNAVIIYNGEILDGRTRVEIAKKLGIPYPVEHFEGSDEEALAYVISYNLYRRHLSQSQKAAVAARLVHELQRLEGLSKHEAVEKAMQVTGSAERTTLRCVTIAENEPKVFERILDGSETVGHHENKNKEVKVCPMCKRRL